MTDNERDVRPFHWPCGAEQRFATESGKAEVERLREALKWYDDHMSGHVTRLYGLAKVDELRAALTEQDAA